MFPLRAGVPGSKRASHILLLFLIIRPPVDGTILIICKPGEESEIMFVNCPVIAVVPLGALGNTVIIACVMTALANGNLM